jgi:hypothetical protein
VDPFQVLSEVLILCQFEGTFLPTLLPMPAQGLAAATKLADFELELTHFEND